MNIKHEETGRANSPNITTLTIDQYINVLNGMSSNLLKDIKKAQPRLLFLLVKIAQHLEQVRADLYAIKEDQERGRI